MFIVTCLGVNLFIPCERLTEICSKLCLNILALINNFAILCQVHCHDTIATCHCNKSLVIISCLSIDGAIPIVLLTECSIKLTIYSYALWILWALLGQVQSHDTVATTCQWEDLYIITSYCIFYAIPNIWILAELSTKLCLNILTLWGWRYNWLAVLDQVQSYNAIATIGLAENLFIVTCLGVNLFIPCERLTEICSKLCLNILALINNFAILCQVHCHDTIATCHCNKSLVIISCLSIDGAIPIVLLTECSIKLTIYSYALWILWALLGQVQSHDTVATTCQWEDLYIITSYCIFYAIPNIWILAELSTKLCLNILAHWSIWSYRDSINSSELHEHAALFLINQSSELVVGYLYSSHASKHIVLVCSYRSSVLAVSINLRNDSNGIVVNIVINEEVDY